MIKAIILDVDGILAGTREGHNFPEPPDEVLAKLGQLSQQGIFVALCTGKGNFAVVDFVKRAGLDNNHIVDGGGLTFNPVSGKVARVNAIPKDIAREVIAALIQEGIYTEFYGVGNYYIQQDQQGEVAEGRYNILQRRPELVADLAESSVEHEIIRILPVARTPEERTFIEQILAPYTDQVKVSWTMNGSTPGLEFAVTTRKGISKGTATEELLETQGIDFADTLGMGDTMHDWQFMERCGYKATLENAKPELLEKIRQHGGYIGPHVNEDGILDIFKNFEL